MDSLNFYKIILNIAENATDEQVDWAYDEYVSKNGLRNPDDAANILKGMALNRLRDALKDPIKKQIYLAQIRAADRYQDDTVDFKLLCILKDELIERLNKLVKSQDETIKDLNTMINALKDIVNMQEKQLALRKNGNKNNK